MSVVVPVYNSAETLRTLASRLVDALKGKELAYELILVDDDSLDDSWSVIEGLAFEHDWIKGIQLMRNFGQHNALLCGIREAKHDIIVTMDDDLQHPPEEIPRLLGALSEDHDVVYGTPQTEQHGLFRNIASRVTKLALRTATGANIAPKVSAFRAFRTSIRKAFANYENPFVSIDVLLGWGTTRFHAIPVHHDPRASGSSNYTFSKLLIHAVNMLTGFSTWPLRFVSIVGFIFTLFGLVVLGYVLVRYLIEGGSVPGFPFLASIIATFSGAQMFALGITGEYLGRMHHRTMGRPFGVVRTYARRGPASKGESSE